MALRMTGMMSGLDTESIIQELVAARQTKVDKQKKAQTSLNWKQEAWKDLNTKLRGLQKKYLANMKYSDAYTKKTTKVSNSSAVSVITGANAVNGVQSLRIESLAKNGYLTGATVKSSGGKLTALSKLSDMKGFTGGEGVINIKTGDKDIDVAVNGDTTISDVLTQLKNAGLNASFDEKWQRFSISSKESGSKNDFSITASDGVGDSALAALGIQTDIKNDKATLEEYEKFAKYFVAGDRTATLTNMKGMIDKDVESRKNSYLNQYKSLKDSMKAAQDKIDEIEEKYKDFPLETADAYASALEAKNKEIKEKQEEIEKLTNPDQKKTAQEDLEKLTKEADTLTEKLSAAQAVKTQQDNLTKYGEELAKVESYISVPDNGDGTYSATAKLQGEVDDRYYNKASYAAEVISKKDVPVDPNNPDNSDRVVATKIDGQDAVIYLNGAKYENDTNSFEINGLTFTALIANKDEEITVTTEQDTDGIYDMIKNFLKEYNAVLNEMDKLYNADSAKGYEPLTDEEKDSMSEKDIEKWEKKVKDSLLRRDENISSVTTAMSSIMAEGIMINGKEMHLFDFGIEPLGYFEAADNEHHAYHIAGDPDDAATMNKEDKLKTMISNDPDAVISFFTKLSRNLDTKMTELSKSVNGYRSYGSFYDDKKMKSDYDDYTTKIKEMEAKLTEYEDKWYKKFSKMETALAKMQSNASAVTGLLGG